MNSLDPALVALTVGGNLISGFAPGTFIEVSRDEMDWTMQTGADGEVARMRNRNAQGSIKVTLMQGSASNAVLSALAAADRSSYVTAGPAYVKDLATGETFGGAESFVEGMPTAAFATEVQTREWTIKIPRLDAEF